MIVYSPLDYDTLLSYSLYMPFQKGNQFGKENLGRIHSIEARKRMSEAGKGRVFTEEHKRKIALSRMGDKHPLWRGGNVTKGAALHNWIRRRLIKPHRCQMCNEIPKPRKDGKFPLDLSNISYKYKRDLSDWEWLCHKCHMNKDGITERLSRERPVMRGSENPRWTGGKPKCVDCKNKLCKSYKAVRCRECYLKLEIRGKRGQNRNILQTF